MELIKGLNWRYATKQFDKNKTVNHADIELLKEAVRLAPSSFGLQPYTVFIIETEHLKTELKAAAWGQNQVTDASHLFVFCSYSTLKDEHIEDLFDLKAEAFNKDKSEFDGYISFIKGKVAEKSPETIKIWNSRQAYIGLGNLINACAELKIDACPMEGFDANKVNTILNLESQGLNAVVLAAVGYRSEEDQMQHLPKIRKATNNLFKTI